MIHQIAADLVGAVGHPIRRGCRAGIQEESGNLDRMGSEHEDPARSRAFAAVPPFEANRGGAPVRAHLDDRRRRLCMEGRAALFRPGDVHRRVIFRLDRADRDAAGIAAAPGPVVAIGRIAALRRRANLVLRAGERPCVGFVEKGLRDRRHRIASGAWRSERLGGVARYADLVLGLTIEGLQVGVRNRPVDAAAVGGAQAKIVRNQAQAGAEPVPRRAADHLDIGAPEFVRPDLPVPVVGIVGDRVIGLRARRVGAFGHLDQGVPEALRCLRAIDPRASLQDSDLHPGAGQPRGKQRAGDARPDDDHIRFDVGHGENGPGQDGGSAQ
jgi:hypothetical protein